MNYKLKMNSHPKISVIVPVYNTAQYLPRCIDSILSQSFTDFELLLIDDGSTDNSGSICDANAEKDSRVRVFHKENGGVSSARNIGLDEANGEWVCFVDSDDEMLCGGLQTLADGITDNVDVVMGAYEEVDGQVEKTDFEGDYKSVRLNKKQSVITLYSGYSIQGKYCGYTWMRLFRREIIVQQKIRFDTDIAIKEDTLFVMQYVCRSSGITQYITRPVYRYYHRQDSAMGRTKQGFDYNYVSSFYAVVAMKNEVQKVFPMYSEAVFVAKQEVYGRCCTILDRMRESGVRDQELKNKLLKETRSEVGPIILFKVRRKMRKWLKKNKKYQSIGN